MFFLFSFLHFFVVLFPFLSFFFLYLSFFLLSCHCFSSIILSLNFLSFFLSTFVSFSRSPSFSSSFSHIVSSLVCLICTQKKKTHLSTKVQPFTCTHRYSCMFTHTQQTGRQACVPDAERKRKSFLLIRKRLSEEHGDAFRRWSDNIPSLMGSLWKLQEGPEIWSGIRSNIDS